MNASYEKTGTLLEAAKHNPPLVFDARGNGGGKIVPTITGDHNGHISDYTAICIGNGQTRQLIPRDKACALNCMHDQQAVIPAPFSPIRRLTPLECERLQGYPDGWTKLGELDGVKIWTDERGRKYPDLVYKYIGADGKPHKLTDSARYKALGNSIALPFWQWLLSRISAQYEDHTPTLGSLFDGIGGFPLCWERCNGKGTAR